MNEAYLQKVLIYLQQELPEHKAQITAANGRIIFEIETSGQFQQVYDQLNALINACVLRIRNREIDLDFTIKAKNQERDFKIIKTVIQ